MYLNFYRGEALKEMSEKPDINRASLPVTMATSKESSGFKSVPPLRVGAFSSIDDETKRLRHLKLSTLSGAEASGHRRSPVNVGPSTYSKEEIDVLRCVFLFFCCL